jgi:hypothetical protein
MRNFAALGHRASPIERRLKLYNNAPRIMPGPAMSSDLSALIERGFAIPTVDFPRALANRRRAAGGRRSGLIESLRRDPRIMRVGRPCRRVVVVGLVTPARPALSRASGE